MATYEVQLFSIDARTASNLNSRRCYFYDTNNNASNTFLAGDGVYVKGRFVAAGTTQVVKAFSLPPEEGGSGAAGFLNMAILRKFKDTSMVRGYAAHWDASDSSTITQSGGLVSEWRDKSGNGYHLSQSTDANKPRIDTHTQNSLPVMDFNGTTQYLLVGSNNLLKDATGTTIYCVAKVEDGGSGSPNTRTMLFVSNGTNVQHSRALLDIGRTTNKPAVAGRRLDADSLGELIGTNNYGASRYAVYTGILDYANSDAYLYIDQGSNGSTTSFQTSGNSSDTNSLQLTVGSNGALGNFFDGQIAELLVYNVAHTEAERLTVWTELYRKWDLIIGRIQWQSPADIGTGSTCLNTPSGQTLEYGWRFTTTSGTVNGITFAEASCDNETGEAASGGTTLNYTNSDSTFQNLLNTCEYNFGTTTPMLELTLTGLTAFTYYEVQLFYVDKRTVYNHNNRRQRFEDVHGNVSEDYRVGDEKYVIGRFVAESTTQKIRIRYTSGGDTAAASISLLVLRRFN